jgi:hypothetical protein
LNHDWTFSGPFAALVQCKARRSAARFSGVMPELHCFNDTLLTRLPD